MTQVQLPVLHTDQVLAFEKARHHRRTAIRCGRRWGKTALGKAISADRALKGRHVGWFAPDYKRLTPAFSEIATVLHPVKTGSSKVEGLYRTRTGGTIEFWTLEDEDAGRSRKYHTVIIDEGAFTKPNMMDIWEQSIEPTLLDYMGNAIVLSNTNGIDPENFLYRICHDPKYGFQQYHAPSWANPLLPLRRAGETEEQHQLRRTRAFDALRAKTHPLVFQQEYEAEFVDWSGVAFFAKDKLLVDGQPVEVPKICDAVFAVIDTGVKTGKENDGTAVTYFAVSRHFGTPLVILDWDLMQIEGAMLETWLPVVFQQLEHLARSTGARLGTLGAFIEDKVSGSVLIQQATKRGWPAQAIDSALTALGKDERAISVSGYVYREEVKISRPAFDKTVVYKEVSRNHLLGQVVGFRVGDKDAAKRADDLLDTFCYGIAIALGNSEGF